MNQVYQGTPKDIILKLAEQIVDALTQGEIPPSGIHAIALLHVAVGIIKAEHDHSTDMGKMPTFKSMLTVFTRGMTGTEWTKEEAEAFGKDFCEIVESLGGHKLNRAASGVTWTAESSQRVH